MEVEVSTPAPAPDFNFDSNCSSPYITAPSSPQRFTHFFLSAPTSPTRFFHDSSPVSSVPFHWEQTPGVPKPNDDFEFNFTSHPTPPSLSAADELFHAGKIRPLKPPPRLQSPDGATSPKSKKTLLDRDSDFDPFVAAVEETRIKEETRGRERVSSSSSRKGTRSLSPLRVSDIMCDSEDKNVSSSASNSKLFSLSSIPFAKGYRKWRLRDFLLFRSASEGRATDKDPLGRKYEVLSKKSGGADEDVRNSSFRSTESSGSVSRRRGPVSAHELHYTLNRAASEEMKKKTFLPYKQGLLGCLGFNPGMQQISKGIGSFTRS
ncbi:hypothetical protein RJT34_04569 [Clitoria ternatea]|uniref:Calmodulin-binding protein n=1 Tax=Clitoria ternatea TaxID=43366 RepID=A0AAN9KNS2_CLITE